MVISQMQCSMDLSVFASQDSSSNSMATLSVAYAVDLRYKDSVIDVSLFLTLNGLMGFVNALLDTCLTLMVSAKEAVPIQEVATAHVSLATTSIVIRESALGVVRDA